jgi:hypothetical protein
LNRKAFNCDGEAQLVDRLRVDGEAVASLVAVEDGEIVGHILFSNLPIETAQGVIDAVSLAPMAVIPKFQRSAYWFGSGKDGTGGLPGAWEDDCRRAWASPILSSVSDSRQNWRRLFEVPIPVMLGWLWN